MFLCEILVMLIERDLENCIQHLDETWLAFYPVFNPGQQVIFDQHLLDALYEWEEQMANDWPWVETEYYITIMYEAYDWDVMWRAFSDAIEAPVGRMEDLIGESQEWAYIAEMLGCW